jgi:two-component system, response regulator
MDKTCRIIIIEDNKVDRFIIRRFLTKIHAECEIIEFDIPQEAAKFFSSATSPGLADLIITDLNMPAVSGHDIIKAIRANPVLNDIPIAVLTSSNSPKDVELANKNGANSFTTKPLNNEKVEEIMKLVKK